MKKKKILTIKWIIGISIILLLIFPIKVGMKYINIEDLNLPIGIGYDIDKLSDNNVEYSVASRFYIFKQNGENDSYLDISKGKTLADSREQRQFKNPRKFLLGSEKVYILSEEASRFGISNIFDILLANPQVNDSGLVCVCKGRAENILSHNVKGMVSSADFVEGIIKTGDQNNFLPDSFDIMESYISYQKEGENLILPYIELNKGQIKISGYAAFNKDKMVTTIDKSDLKYLNMLRFSSVQGILTSQKSLKEYANLQGSSKRKVKCSKKDGRYSFVIDVNYLGDVASNEYKGQYNLKTIPSKNELEKSMSEELTKNLTNFITKMQNEYKLDLISLGNFAAAKYGRHLGIDWNEVVNNADIKVNAKVKLKTQGRGNF